MDISSIPVCKLMLNKKVGQIVRSLLGNFFTRLGCFNIFDTHFEQLFSCTVASKSSFMRKLIFEITHFQDFTRSLVGQVASKNHKPAHLWLSCTSVSPDCTHAWRSSFRKRLHQKVLSSAKPTPRKVACKLCSSRLVMGLLSENITSNVGDCPSTSVNPDCAHTWRSSFRKRMHQKVLSWDSSTPR